MIVWDDPTTVYRDCCWTLFCNPLNAPSTLIFLSVNNNRKIIIIIIKYSFYHDFFETKLTNQTSRYFKPKDNITTNKTKINIIFRSTKKIKLFAEFALVLPTCIFWCSNNLWVVVGWLKQLFGDMSKKLKPTLTAIKPGHAQEKLQSHLLES